MGMVVRSNIMAVNAQRQLGVNNNQVSKALEKLSSGYRINRAGDDASGLAISEKMKAQIKGLDTASLNAQDGISVVQTAEGALTEVHNMLNRMVELATRSANGINADLNRDALQNEVSALQEEIDRIAQATTFNDIHLLDGTGGSGAGGTTSTEKAEFKPLTSDTVTIAAGTAGGKASAEIDFAGFEGTKAGKVDVKLGDIVVGTVDVTEGMTAAEFAQALDGKTFKVKADDGTTELTFTATANGEKVKFEADKDTAVKVDGTGTAGLDFQKVVLEAQEQAAGAAKAAAADAPEKPDFSGANALTFDDADGNGASADASGLDADAIQAALDAAAAADPTVTGGNITIELNQAGDGYELKAGNVLLGSTGNAANNSIVGADNAGTDKALVFTTADGTALGKSENIQAANSRIRDTDMAKMMMEYTKVNVVTQSAQAMLAQANQQPQSVLQLLQ